MKNFETVSFKWYALYTRPRWEKKVNKLLVQKGIESYCPLNKVRRKWSDRVKTIEEPLFKSYVFVKIEDAGRTEVRMTDGVINFVYWDGKPAIIKDKEIQTIRNFLDEYDNVQLASMDLKQDQRVRIIAGPLMDQEGKIIELGNKVAKVAIDSLGCILVASIDKNKLMSAQQNSTKE
jgi:transcription antitermination factor NusG